MDKKKKSSYIQLQYEFSLDPIQIYKKAMKNNDIDAIKNINFPASITAEDLFGNLGYVENGTNNKKNIHAYVWDKIINKYDMYKILILSSHNKGEVIDKVFNIISTFCIEVDYEYVYA